MENPLVSIVIPTFNRADFLIEAVGSALAQSYDAVEVIVVDDCSTDETQKFIADFSDNRLNYYRQEPNIGMPRSWGVGLAMAQGEFVCFLGDDDRLRPDYVRHRMRSMQAAPEVDVTFSRYDECDRQGKFLASSGPPAASLGRLDPLTLMKMALSIEWFIGATMYRKSAVASLWAQIEADGYVFDVGLHARLVIANKGQGIVVPENDVINTRHAGQTSHSKRQAMFQQKSTLLACLLRESLSAPMAKVIKREAAQWQVVWGRQLAAEGFLREARLHLAAAVRLDPTLLGAWKQMVISWLPSRQLMEAD